MAFIVSRAGLVSALSSPNSLCSEPRHSRSAALQSLLEATEDRIREVVWRTTSGKEPPKRCVPPPQLPNPPPKELPENSVVVDYSEKPVMKEKNFWRKHISNTYAPHV